MATDTPRLEIPVGLSIYHVDVSAPHSLVHPSLFSPLPLSYWRPNGLGGQDSGRVAGGCLIAGSVLVVSSF